MEVMTEAQFKKVSVSEWEGISYESYLRWIEEQKTAIYHEV